MNFAAFDLNLLRVFDAMALDLNTTRAGERVGLSQPAVSAALARLRHATGDELFVREGNRMAPTPRALELAGPIRAALRQVEDALAAGVGFDPATARRTFKIAGSDYFSSLLMPPLAAAIAPRAPGVIVQMIDHASAPPLSLLSEGAVDLAVGVLQQVPEHLRSQTLIRSTLVCVAARGHPDLARAGVRPGERIPADLFCALPQVMMSMDGALVGSLDGPLAAHGYRRRVAVTVPHFHAAALVAARSTLVSNLPVHFARLVAESLGLETYLPPVDAPALDVEMFWARRHDADAASRWLRGEVARALDLDAATTIAA